ncbi:MAG: bifunctional pyr operon transcriptional regulator/uracil phosphoribosyltransferase PyrR [Nitrospinaceae bacterium]|jgi:pyrimidine operon attenuation protein/uracil phosphoribosyltransferase|nr:bifunctional pyr operon transcriptional regulator/uracil phosphoribosyltransferase PyrR [Nitrospinaceae bacterium]
MGFDPEGVFFCPEPEIQLSSVIFNEKDISRAVTRIAHEILEKNKGADKLALVGIRTRGATLAQRLAKKINEIESTTVSLGILDITLYRDDLGTSKQSPEVKKTDISFSLEGKEIVLIDDVLYTGRTIRAAIDALIDFGRPATVQLGVLIDRGHRELPIRPDYIGKNLPTSKSNQVQVHLKEDDGVDEVILINILNKKG